MAVCSEIHTKYINKLCGQDLERSNVNMVVHRVITYHLMLYMELIALLFSDPHQPHKYTMWKNVELSNVKLVVYIMTAVLYI